MERRDFLKCAAVAAAIPATVVAAARPMAPRAFQVVQGNDFGAVRFYIGNGSPYDVRGIEWEEGDRYVDRHQPKREWIYARGAWRYFDPPKLGDVIMIEPGWASSSSLMP